MYEPLGHHPWAEAYQQAVLESDSAKLSSRIETAKSAIASRVDELTALTNLAAFTAELDSMHKALQILRTLAEGSVPRRAMTLIGHRT